MLWKGALIMRLMLDKSRHEFQVNVPPKERLDQNGQQRRNRDGMPMWTTVVEAWDPEKETSDSLNVTTAGEAPKVTRKQLVALEDFEAIPWNTNGKNGVAYRAVSIRPVPAQQSNGSGSKS